ncbi:MAG TPA: hypothetical protein VFT98_11270 [Myxococcota bacterium]|nr:hypothetical protein [Myxococcota bacterium]
MRRALIALAAAVAVFVAVTWLALEGSGVAVVTTTTPDGSPRETHVWFAELGGVLWLEAGLPENPWFTDAQRSPRIRLALPGAVATAFDAHPVPTAEAQQRVRAALHHKYGWRDTWVGLLVDASRSVAVRLDPAR